MKVSLIKRFFFIVIIPYIISCVQEVKKTPQQEQKLELESKQFKNLSAQAEIKIISEDSQSAESIIIDQETGIITQTRRKSSKGTENSTVRSLNYDSPPPFLPQTAKLAILLPLTGQYSEVGLTLQSGIIEEYFKLSDKLIEISFHDSNIATINQLYQKLVADQHTTIIGPIISEQIEKIDYSMQVSNILLNRKEEPSIKTYVFDFKEYSRSEINQITNRLKEQLHKNILLITDNNISGGKFADTFAKSWFSEGNIVSKVIYLSSNITDNAKKIRTFLNTQPKLTKYIYNEGGVLSKTVDIKDDFAYIRQDIDAILLSTEADNARLINALLKTISGLKPPIYSSSLLTKSSDFNISKEQNLNNINYLDSSWRYSQKNSSFLRSFVQDIIRIALNIENKLPFTYKGFTGDYIVTIPEGMVRQQSWYRFQNGGAIPIQATIN